MAGKHMVLVTGAAGTWGSRLAARLLVEDGYQVLGLDGEPPTKEVTGLDLIQAEVRNPLLVELLKSEGVEVVCHLAFVERRRPNETAFDQNVMGTANLLGACAAAGVTKVVLKSSMAVYGAWPTNSAFLSEEQPLRGSPRCGQARDLVEMERFCSAFRREHSELALTILRFPSIVGPAADTPMARFLKEPWAPSLFGFDPMMQIIHEDDVVEALAHAVLHDRPGVFNVAAAGVLPLSKIRGLAGKPPVVLFHKLAYWAAVLPGAGPLPLGRWLPIAPDYLRYPWVGDLTRMHQEFGFESLHTAEETLREFAQRFREGRFRAGVASSDRAEERLRDIIERRRRAREREAEEAAREQKGGGSV